MNNRWDNLVWTIAGNYDFDINYNIFNDKIKSKYKIAIVGFLYKYYNLDLINEFLNTNAVNYNNKNDLLFIAELILEYSIIEKIKEERPGIIEEREKYADKTLKQYIYSAPSNIKQELEKASCEDIKNKIPKINGTLYKLFNEIKNYKYKDTADAITFIKKIYEKYFHIYPNMPEVITIEKIVAKAKKEPLKKSSLKKSFSNKAVNLNELEKYTIQSAEFTAAEYSDLKIITDTQKSSSSSIDNLKEKVKKHYGEEDLINNKSNTLEKLICTGVHEGIHLYFTNGEYKSNDSLYFKNKAEESYEKNIKFYKENELLYKRSIKNLEEIIKNSLLRNTEEYDILSYSGTLDSSIVWKSTKNIDRKIFKKTFKENNGNISVDIILDQSASQYKRQSQVAVEGYIIAEALTNLNIKTRVIGFNNFYNYMIIRKFRDYNDSKIKNNEIFKYNASGSNRDGLIIKLMSYFIEKNTSERKIMIILSDGKPNDEIDLGLIGVKNINAMDYTDETAIHDSFNQVLISRLKGINVLGVFMGDEEELEAEKKIFGRNFAYINDIKRFHHIAGIFFKSISNEYDF